MLCSTYCTLEHLRIFSACRHHTQIKGITDQFPVQFLIEHCTQCPVEQLDDLCAVIVLSGIIIGKLQKITSIAGSLHIFCDLPEIISNLCLHKLIGSPCFFYIKGSKSKGVCGSQKGIARSSGSSCKYSHLSPLSCQQHQPFI